MANNAKFAKQIKKFVKLSDKTATKDVRTIALVGFKTVQVESRVDNGTFRGNWNVALDEIDDNTDKKYKSGVKAGNTDYSSFNKGSVIIDKFENGQQINITNNMPYSAKLNAEDAYITKGLKNMERASKKLKGKV